MQCSICGSDKAKYYVKQRQVLCRSCLADTPEKLSKSEFDQKYWGSPEEVSSFIRIQFYDDYKASNLNFDDYKKQTTKINY